MKSIALHNLGCKVNAYEMEVMQQKFEESGYEIVPFDSKADVYLVNTCTVTNIADRKSRQMLHRAKKNNPRAVVVAVGCYVQTGGARAQQDDCVDLAVGNNRKKDIVEIVEAYLAKRQAERETGEKQSAPATDTDVVPLSESCAYEEMRLFQTAEHTRAYIKIQDGCNQFCSYCIIPYARGRVRSRRPEDALAEMEGLAKKGYREMVITGIHLSSYGRDFSAGSGQAFDAEPLLRLLEKAAQVPGVERIRLGSLEPRIVTEEFVRRLAAIPQLCPHFHLSLQSGCDETLRRMNRHYTAGEYYEKVEILRRCFDNPAITTDIIVGFPGETEEEFAVTRAFVEKVRFFETHIFQYSRRKGTLADRMPHQVPGRIRQERSVALLALDAVQSRRFREAYIGRSVRLLVEEKKRIGGAEYWVGHAENYIRCAVPAEFPAKENRIVPGTGTELLTEEILLLEPDGSAR